MPLVDRRSFMVQLSALGVGGVLADAIWTAARGQERVTTENLRDAEAVAGLEFTPEERELMVRGVNRQLAAYDAIRSVEIPNAVPPAFRFDPGLPHVPGGPAADLREAPSPADRFAGIRVSTGPGIGRPADLEEVAFWPVSRLAELIRTREVSAVELTQMYLDRLRRHGPALEAVITLTDDLALRQARRADEELAAGRYRGPLHGIPWGAKDLLSTEEYRTTWGARPFVDQVIPEDATVVRRLEEAGAVLVAKLTLGALAMGDVWFGGTTRNPWDPEQGSSGSSAGSAAATVAGLVGFAIGTETLGSIVSPATRTGASGLRPTFGRVSRHGAMALSWTMDKVGPICRTAEDCALVLAAIHGADGLDPTARTVPFTYRADRPLSDLRIGYLQSGFEREVRGQDEDARARMRRQLELENRALATLRDLGIEPAPVELPDDLPVGALRIILQAEAAAAFDELTRSGRDDMLVAQEAWSWPNSFRQSRMIPAVEYIQANRIRTLLMERMARTMADIDVFVTPSYAGSVLLTTNLTGHPTAVAPAGFIDGRPTSISFVGGLWQDDAALRLAAAFQGATDFHQRVPVGFGA